MGLTVYREAAESSNDHANPGHHDKAEHSALGRKCDRAGGSLTECPAGDSREDGVTGGKRQGLDVERRLTTSRAPIQLQGRQEATAPHPSSGASSDTRHCWMPRALKRGPQGGRGDSYSKRHARDCKGLNCLDSEDSVQALTGSPPTSVLSFTHPE